MSQLNNSEPLWKRIGELAASSAFLLYLADVASDRLSLTQAAFFMEAAKADAKGSPATRTELINARGDVFSGSIRNSYKQLLEPSRRYEKALSWLTTEENLMDNREKWLRLTDEGRAIIENAIDAMRQSG